MGHSDWFKRAFLSLMLLAGIGAVVRQTVAALLAKSNTIGRVNAAHRWDPSNPEYPAQFAAITAKNSVFVDSDRLIPPFQETVRLGPNRAESWLDLADLLEISDRFQEADIAYRRAVQLFPKSPRINWEFANHLIRQNKLEEATGPLRLAILGDPSLRNGGFDVAWRAGISNDRILALANSDPFVLSAYLDYLVRTNRPEASSNAWNCLIASAKPFDRDSAFRYFDALLNEHNVDKMLNIWRELAARNAGGRAQPSRTNLIYNEGFEERVMNGGFDWRLSSVPGAVTSLDSTTEHAGSQALVIHFDGTRNPDFGQVAQYVAVLPNTSYQLKAYVRAENITSDSGPRIEIADAFAPSELSLESSNMLGTYDWMELTLDVHTGKQTRLLVFQVVRPKSQKLSGLIAGTFWLDDVSLIAIPSLQK